MLQNVNIIIIFYEKNNQKLQKIHQTQTNLKSSNLKKKTDFIGKKLKKNDKILSFYNIKD